MLSSLSSFWPQTSSHRPRLLAAPQAPRVPLRVTQASLLSSLPCSTRGTSAWAAGKSCVWGLPPTRSRRARANPEWPLRAPVTAQARVPRSKHLGADVAEQSLGRAARGSAAVVDQGAPGWICHPCLGQGEPQRDHPHWSSGHKDLLAGTSILSTPLIQFLPQGRFPTQEHTEGCERGCRDSVK